LVFALLLWFTKTINRSANRFLALALVIMILWMVRLLAIDIKLETYIPHWDWLPIQFLLALGPLLYFYVLKITCPTYRFSWKDFLHLSPLLLEQAILAFEVNESARTGAATYATHVFRQTNPLLQLFIFISVITYLDKSHKLIQNFYRQLIPVLMDRSLLEFRWLRRLLAATALLWSLWIACAAIDYFGYHNQLNVQFYYPFYILFAVIIIWTATAAFLKPQAASIAQIPASAKPIIPEELRTKGVLLKRSMEANLYYEDPDLSLSSLAEKLGWPPHELSRVINTVFKKGFNDYINEYRIREVISKMKDPAYDNITLLGIAFEAGFNSKATFNRSFKQMTGKSPAEFKKILENKDSTYHLRQLPRFSTVISTYQVAYKGPELKLNRNYMFKNHFKHAWRSIKKNRQFTWLNLVGLSTGLAGAILIFLWVSDELSINKFHANDKRLYQLMNNFKTADGTLTWDHTPVPLSDALLKEMPEVEDAVSVNDFFNFGSKEGIVSAGDVQIQSKGFIAGADFFNVFSYPLLQGDKNNVLIDESNIVISEGLAKKLFKTTDAIGKTINWSNAFFKGVYRVSGVFKQPPANSTQQFDFVMHLNVLIKNDRWAKEWTGNYAETFVVLKANTDAAIFNKKIAGYLQTKNLEKFTMFLQPYSARYLHGTYENGVQAGGRIEYVRLFSIIALFVLLIACINFTNLSTAQAANKMKEVGIKKTIGASRRSLVIQFLSESLLMALMALVIAALLIILLLPQFNSITSKTITLRNAAGLGLPVIGIALFTGFIAGCYPAFYLSRFQPVAVLKGKLVTSLGELWVRKGLVVVQFSLSVIFMIGFMVVNRQIKFTQTKNLGYNKDNILTFTWKGELYTPWDGLEEGKSNTTFEAFMDALKKLPGVVHASNMGGGILADIPGQSGVSWSGDKNEENYLFQSPLAGYDWLETLGISLKEGRSFSKLYHDDYNKIILNEAAVKVMKLTNPVGKKINMNGGSEIIGVVKDFHYGSLHNAIEPMIIRLQPNGRNVMVKTKPGMERRVVDEVRETFNKFLPGYSFDFSFMDDDYQALYLAEQRIAVLSSYFAGLAIIISCLGLFGLAAFTAQKRRKEIGIRKVVGASTLNVMVMLSRSFLQLVLVAVIIALPLAWWLLRNWLEGFADKITISWWVLVIPCILALAIALITVSFKAFKVAGANPAESLKTE
jgi:ABC-type antimicrobial peptide transport system permease subunit/AraC-like DNA-binding protein